MWEEKPVQIGHIRLSMASGPDNGPPILLLHGVARGWRDFSPVLPTLQARYRVTALDLRGHGRSDRANSYLVNDYLRDVVALVRNYYPRPVILWGHSLGAMVSVGVAAYCPDHVAAVILEDPPFHTMGERINPSLQAFFAGLQVCANGSQQPVAELARRIGAIRLPLTDGATVCVSDVRDATQIRLGARCLLDLDPAVIEPVVRGQWLDGYDVQRILSRVRCPALLLAGDFTAGGMLTPEDALKVCRTVPDCTRVDIRGAGHLLHWQRTDEVLRHALAFLESL